MGTNISKQGIAFASGAVNPNLAKNSLVNIAPTSVYNIANFDLTDELTAGEKFTVTLKGTIGADKSFGLWMGNGWTNVGFFTLLTNGLFALTFTSPTTIGGSGSRTRINLYAYPSDNTNTSSLEWLKIEKGVTSTAWIPAITDTIYVGNTCGFTEFAGTQSSIAKECISAPQFYEL